MFDILRKHLLSHTAACLLHIFTHAAAVSFVGRDALCKAGMSERTDILGLNTPAAHGGSSLSTCAVHLCFAAASLRLVR